MQCTWLHSFADTDTFQRRTTSVTAAAVVSFIGKLLGAVDTEHCILKGDIGSTEIILMQKLMKI
jgi:hypothetical protein